MVSGESTGKIDSSKEVGELGPRARLVAKALGAVIIFALGGGSVLGYQRATEQDSDFYIQPFQKGEFTGGRPGDPTSGGKAPAVKHHNFKTVHLLASIKAAAKQQGRPKCEVWAENIPTYVKVNGRPHEMDMSYRPGSNALQTARAALPRDVSMDARIWALFPNGQGKHPVHYGFPHRAAEIQPGNVVGDIYFRLPDNIQPQPDDC